MNKLLAILLLALSLPAFAALEVGDVKFDDKAKVGAGDTVINGAGLRKVLFIKGYAMALYLPQKAATMAEVLTAKGAKRIHLVLLRDASGETFADALASGIRKNHSEAEIASLNARIETLKATMIGIGTVAKGAVIHLDWLPELGSGAVRLAVNGEKKGEDIAGEDFFRALLKIWLGDKPIQDDLKDNLLGKAS
ncbi:MAG: putative lipoprotein transmembrane [Rhodocyclaceae bacterium]|nr:MAG: putative lipoprotein transmembrane [Rhodocyclaceae bacterium]TND03038.1 MAG: putative lipoprotein transmembrane [Rhodocyclaceae bacterium]